MNSLLEMYAGKRGKNSRKEPVMTDHDAPPSFMRHPAPHDRQVPVPARPQHSTRSERAMQAAAELEQLENEVRDLKAKYEIEINALRAEREAQVNALQTELHENKGRLASVEKANDILNADLAAEKLQNESNRSRLSSQRAKLEVAAKIILDLANEEVRAPLTDQQSEDAHRAVADALE